MSFNAHDNIVLVAPRPVRLATPSSYTQFHPAIVRPQPRAAVRLVSCPPDSIDRLKIGDESGDEGFGSEVVPSEREPTSPRASPRANLNSEALEEFLSILRPSTSFLFPPTSPILRASKANGATTYYSYRRTPSSVSPSIPSDGLGLTIADVETDKENDSSPYRFFSKGPLASPIARQLTRNPFQRHASYDSGVTTYITAGPTSPSPIGSALSPAAIPLPSPGPDEADL